MIRELEFGLETIVEERVFASLEIKNATTSSEDEFIARISRILSEDRTEETDDLDLVLALNNEGGYVIIFMADGEQDLETFINPTARIAQYFHNKPWCTSKLLIFSRFFELNHMDYDQLIELSKQKRPLLN